MPHGGPEEAAGAAASAAQAPEAVGGVQKPEVDGGADGGKGPFGDAGGAQGDADGREEDAVAQGHAGVARRVGPGEHTVAGGAVLVADGPRQRHEVRELPGKQKPGHQPAAHALLAEEKLAPVAGARGALPGRRRPPHQRRDGAHDGARPRVGGRHAFQWRVDAGVQGDVEAAQARDGRVHAKVQRRDARGARDGGEGQRAAARDESAHQRPVPRAAHHGVPPRLVQHVERVGAGRREPRTDGEKEQRQRAEAGRVGECGRQHGRHRVQRIGRRGRQDNHDRQPGLGEREQRGERPAKRVRGECR